MGDKRSLDQVLENVDSGRRNFLKTLLLGAVAVPLVTSVALTQEAGAQEKKEEKGKDKKKKGKKKKGEEQEKK